MDAAKRRQNEQKFDDWEDLPNGGRRYILEVAGQRGWKARYVKEVDPGEVTTAFYQEVYDENGALVENHQKYPVDTGHRKVDGSQ